MVEDGPVTLVTQAQGEGGEGWAATQVIVVEEGGGDFVIPVEETQVSRAAIGRAKYSFCPMTGRDRQPDGAAGGDLHLRSMR